MRPAGSRRSRDLHRRSQVTDTATRPGLGLPVVVLAVVGALAAALAGCHPTGWAPADVVLTMGLAAGVIVAASRARPWTWAVLVAPGLVLTTGWLFVVSVVALVVVALALLVPPPRRWQGALAAGLGVQVLLRLPATHLMGASVTGATAGVVALAVMPVIGSAWRAAGARARRQVRRAVVGALVFTGLATVGLGVAALSGRTGVQRGLLHAERGLDAAESGDQDRAADELDQSSAGFAQARQQFAAPWTWPARVVPVLGHYAVAASLAAEAGHSVAASGAAAARQVPYDQLSPKDGQVDLELLRSAGPPVDSAATALEDAAARVDGLDTTWLVPPLVHRLAGLRDDLRKTIPEARGAADAVRLAPAMLGGTGTRHYLVLFGNPAEARPLGGYVGAYGELTASAGRLELTRSSRTADLHLPAGPALPADPAGFEERYSGFQPTSHLGNVTASPDFGEVAVESARLFGMALAVHFDGVLYVDPYGLEALLKLTGPITVEGMSEPLTEHTTAAFLVHDQYTIFAERAERFDFLTEAATATFRLLTNAKLPEPRQAFKALYPAVQSGRLRFVAFDPAENDLLGQAGLTGSFPEAGSGDLIGLGSTNESPNKTDAFVHRSLRYEATLDTTHGTVDAVVTARVSNDAPLNLSSYVLSNRDLMEGVVGGRPFGSNSSLVSFYTPLLLDGAQIDGKEVAMTSQDDVGTHVYRAFITVVAGGTVEVVLHLHGPIDLSQAYQLTVVHQANVNDDTFELVVHDSDASSPAVQAEAPIVETRVLTFPVRAR